MNTAVTSLPISPATSAGAAFGVGLRRQFSRAGAAIWRALEAVGRARAQRSLLDLADEYEALQPAFAQELRAATRQGPMA